MSIFLAGCLILLFLLLGVLLGARWMQKRANLKIAEYERARLEEERKKAALSVTLCTELARIREGLAQISSAYEDVVEVVEREFDRVGDLHLALKPPPRRLAIEHRREERDAQEPPAASAAAAVPSDSVPQEPASVAADGGSSKDVAR